MSDEKAKKVSNTTAAIAGALAVGGTIFGGGMKAAEYQNQVQAAKAEAKEAKAEAARMLEQAAFEKQAAIDACKDEAEEIYKQQQVRVDLLLKRLEAIARDRSARPDMGQYKNYRETPKLFQKGM